MITSAALYFSSRGNNGVPIECLEGVKSFLQRHQLVLSHFDVWADGFSEDVIYDYSSAAREQLVDVVQRRKASNLGLYSDLVMHEGGESWSAMASFEMAGEMLFLGIDERLAGSCAGLLRSAVEIAEKIEGIGYGIGFKYPLARSPSGFAAGVPVITFNELAAKLKSASSSQSWLDERQGAKRYLKGMFRGAFPASILSSEHIDILARKRISIGVIQPLPKGLYLWDLTEVELQLAEKALQQAGLLVG